EFAAFVPLCFYLVLEYHRDRVQPRPFWWYGLKIHGTAISRAPGRYCFFLPFPDLEDLAIAGGGSEFGGTWLAGRGEADLVAVPLQRVDAEHDFFVGRDGVHLLWCFRFVELDRPRLAGGVLRRARESERVTLKDDRRLLHLDLGQGLPILHRRIEVPSALQPVQVRLRRRRRGRLTVACRQQQAEGRDHQQPSFHDAQSVNSCVAERKAGGV